MSNLEKMRIKNLERAYKISENLRDNSRSDESHAFFSKRCIKIMSELRAIGSNYN